MIAMRFRPERALRISALILRHLAYTERPRQLPAERLYRRLHHPALAQRFMNIAEPL